MQGVDGVDWEDEAEDEALTKIQKSGATGKVLSLEVDSGDSNPAHSYYNIEIGGKKFTAISGHHIKII